MKIKTVSGVFLLACLMCMQPGQAAPASLIDTGHKVFKHWCAPCHGSGKHMPGTQALAAKYNGSIPAVLEQRTDLTPELVRTFVRQGMNIMPPFRKTEISDAELNALATYLARKGSH